MFRVSNVSSSPFRSSRTPAHSIRCAPRPPSGLHIGDVLDHRNERLQRVASVCVACFFGGTRRIRRRVTNLSAFLACIRHANVNIHLYASKIRAVASIVLVRVHLCCASIECPILTAGPGFLLLHFGPWWGSPSDRPQKRIFLPWMLTVPKRDHTTR